MRTFRYLQVAVLSLLVGSVAILYAQDQKQEDNHPAQEQAHPENRQDTARPDDARTAHPEAAAPMKPENRNAPEQAAPDRDHPQARPEDHPENRAQEHPEQVHNAPAAHGERIPDNDFHAHFGSQHHFRAQGIIIAGHPEFRYQGYNFQLVQPWPAGWAYTDDCYIDYIDGQYYLIDLVHPGIRLAIVIM